MADYGAGIVYPQVSPIAGTETTAAGYQSAANALSQGANQAAATAAQARTAKYEMEMRMRMQERQNLINGVNQGLGRITSAMWRRQERVWELEDQKREQQLEQDRRQASGYLDEVDQGMNLDPYLWGPHAAATQEAYSDFQTWSALQGRVAGELFTQDLYNYRYNILDLGAKRSGIKGGAQGVLDQLGGKGPESRPAPTTQPSGDVMPGGGGGQSFAPSSRPEPGSREYWNQEYERRMGRGDGPTAYDRFASMNGGRPDRVAEWGRGVLSASQKQAQSAQQSNQFEESLMGGISRADHMNTAITGGIPGVVQAVTQDPNRGPVAGELFSSYVNTFSKDPSQITPNDLTAPTPVLKAVNSWFMDLGDQLETALSNGVIADETSRQQAKTVIGSIDRMTYNFSKTVGKSFAGDRIVQDDDYRRALDLISQGRHLDAMEIINRRTSDAQQRFGSFRLSAAAQLNLQYAEEARPINVKLRRIVYGQKKGWQAEADALIDQRETLRAKYAKLAQQLPGAGEQLVRPIPLAQPTPSTQPTPPQADQVPMGVGGPEDW